jgi:uncharacterized protein (TIGR03435 family)
MGPELTDITISLLSFLQVAARVRQRELPEMLTRPSLFDAVRSQLGLKLEATKGPVEYYVVEHIEKPAGN